MVVEEAVKSLSMESCLLILGVVQGMRLSGPRQWLLMADCMNSWRLQEADLQHDGPAQRQIATTPGETRSRPRAVDGIYRKLTLKAPLQPRPGYTDQAKEAGTSVGSDGWATPQRYSHTLPFGKNACGSISGSLLVRRITNSAH